MFAKRKRHHKIMKSSDRQALRKLPRKVIIYRACKPGDLVSEKFNWSLSFEVAKKFFYRWSPYGSIYQKVINRDEIYAYFNSRNEQEVIIDIRKIQR